MIPFPILLILWIAMLLGILFDMITSFRLWRISSTLSVVQTGSKIPGAHIAQKILKHEDIETTTVIESRSEQTDHYDLLRKQIVLSHDVFHGSSIVASAAAAHEAAHAIQQLEGFRLLKIREQCTPLTCFATPIPITLILIGLFTNSTAGLAVFVSGMASFLLLTTYNIVLLNIEFDANKRAKEQLLCLGLISQSEIALVARMLSASTMTYVAGLANIVRIAPFRNG